MARKEKIIDWQRLELYLRSGASQKRICQDLRMDSNTLRKHVKKHHKMDFSDYSASLCSEGELLLEAAQFQKALNSKAKGSVQMLIYLGKVRLGQKEKDSEPPKPPNDSDIERDHQLLKIGYENQQLKKELEKFKTNAIQAEGIQSQAAGEL